MPGSRWCNNCHLTHEGLTGSKCQQFNTMESDQTSDTGGQACTASLSKVTVTSNQARLVAEQVLSPSNSGTATSTGAASNQQDLILVELQRISQRFGKLEDQTNQDRIILKGLVNQISNQQNNPTVTSESNVSPISHSVHNGGPLQPTTINKSQQIKLQCSSKHHKSDGPTSASVNQHTTSLATRQSHEYGEQTVKHHHSCEHRQHGSKCCHSGHLHRSN